MNFKILVKEDENISKMCGDFGHLLSRLTLMIITNVKGDIEAEIMWP